MFSFWTQSPLMGWKTGKKRICALISSPPARETSLSPRGSTSYGHLNTHSPPLFSTFLSRFLNQLFVVIVICLCFVSFKLRKLFVPLRCFENNGSQEIFRFYRKEPLFWRSSASIHREKCIDVFFLIKPDQPLLLFNLITTSMTFINNLCYCRPFVPWSSNDVDVDFLPFEQSDVPHLPGSETEKQGGGGCCRAVGVDDDVGDGDDIVGISDDVLMVTWWSCRGCR